MSSGLKDILDRVDEIAAKQIIERVPDYGMLPSDLWHAERIDGMLHVAFSHTPGGDTVGRLWLAGGFLHTTLNMGMIPLRCIHFLLSNGANPTKP